MVTVFISHFPTPRKKKKKDDNNMAELIATTVGQTLFSYLTTFSNEDKERFAASVATTALLASAEEVLERTRSSDKVHFGDTEFERELFHTKDAKDDLEISKEKIILQCQSYENSELASWAKNFSQIDVIEEGGNSLAIFSNNKKNSDYVFVSRFELFCDFNNDVTENVTDNDKKKFEAELGKLSKTLAALIDFLKKFKSMLFNVVTRKFCMELVLPFAKKLTRGALAWVIDKQIDRTKEYTSAILDNISDPKNLAFVLEHMTTTPAIVFANALHRGTTVLAAALACRLVYKTGNNGDDNEEDDNEDDIEDEEDEVDEVDEVDEDDEDDENGDDANEEEKVQLEQKVRVFSEKFCVRILDELVFQSEGCPKILRNFEFKPPLFCERRRLLFSGTNRTRNCKDSKRETLQLLINKFDKIVGRNVKFTSGLVDAATMTMLPEELSRSLSLGSPVAVGYFEKMSPTPDTLFPTKICLEVFRENRERSGRYIVRMSLSQNEAGDASNDVLTKVRGLLDKIFDELVKRSVEPKKLFVSFLEQIAKRNNDDNNTKFTFEFVGSEEKLVEVEPTASGGGEAFLRNEIATWKNPEKASSSATRVFAINAKPFATLCKNKKNQTVLSVLLQSDDETLKGFARELLRTFATDKKTGSLVVVDHPVVDMRSKKIVRLQDLVKAAATSNSSRRSSVVAPGSVVI